MRSGRMLVSLLVIPAFGLIWGVGCGTLEIERIDYNYVADRSMPGGGYYLVEGQAPSIQRDGRILRHMVPTGFWVEGRSFAIDRAEARRQGPVTSFRFRVERQNLLNLSPQTTREVEVTVEFEVEEGNSVVARGHLPARDPLRRNYAIPGPVPTTERSFE